jgi:hypothetical protein
VGAQGDRAVAAGGAPDGGRDAQPRRRIPPLGIAAIVLGFVAVVGGWVLVLVHGAAEDRALDDIEAVARTYVLHVAAADYADALAEVCEPERALLSTAALAQAHSALGVFSVERGRTRASRVPLFTLRPRTGQAGLRVTVGDAEHVLVIHARRVDGDWCVVTDPDHPLGRLADPTGEAHT